MKRQHVGKNPGLFVLIVALLAMQVSGNIGLASELSDHVTSPQIEQRVVVAWKRRAPEWSSVAFTVPMFAPYNQAKVEIVGQPFPLPENGNKESHDYALYRAGATQNISSMVVTVGSPEILKSIQVPTEFLNLVKLPAVQQVEFETLSVDFKSPPPNMMIAYVNFPFGTQLVAERCLGQELASYEASPQEIELAIDNEEWRNHLGFLNIQIFEDLSHQIEVRSQCELEAQ